MSNLTESLKIEILMMIGYGDRARTQCEVVRLFRETHPDLPPLNQGTISKIEAQYREMGHVRKVPSKRQAVVDDDTKLNLLLALEENPITPARQLARDENIENAHIKCKLFKSYLKMIQIDEISTSCVWYFQYAYDQWRCEKSHMANTKIMPCFVLPCHRPKKCHLEVNRAARQGQCLRGVSRAFTYRTKLPENHKSDLINL
ncbi:hypothetical protein NQ318_011638 [Aromia moschata]|uniref:DUF4817 domain-containing protein n=1 Tax=Aromia moschata TaxID=1265417 RepID=A0AAV8Z7K4_9CUCU|nr:hypothetical protein NQ318_011638 [Aromia moschata]